MTNSPLQIRAAVPADAEVIAEFNVRLAAETEHKTLDPPTIAAGVQALLADPRLGRYFLALRDGLPVGQMMHTREWSDWRNGEIWWLQSVYVVSDARQQGVFRALYQHLESLARATPTVVGLRLYVETHNSRAQDAYVRLGMQMAGYAVMESLFRDIPAASVPSQ